MISDQPCWLLWFNAAVLTMCPCCGLGSAMSVTWLVFTFKKSVIHGLLHFLADDRPIAFKILVACKYSVIRNALNIGGTYPEATHKAGSQLPSWVGVFLNGEIRWRLNMILNAMHPLNINSHGSHVWCTVEVVQIHLKVSFPLMWFKPHGRSTVHE